MNKKKEIFTIGDKTTLGIITCFRLLDNEIMVDFDNKNSILLRSKQLQHVKQPLFTTEDGVDVFEGDDFYTVDNWNIEKYKNYISINEYIHNLKFSTKEKAEEYILMNKPCLSYNEVLNTAKIKNKNTFDSLKELVKQKLNN
jgi:hypothetical protein